MTTAVLVSGGLDSAVLLAEEASRDTVQPIYISVGLAWEARERATLGRLLHAAFPKLAPLVCLSLDMRDVYSVAHWAVRGEPPAYHTPDEDVYLAGRNIVLLGKAAIFCATVQIRRLVLGTLGHNPFPDATPAFRSAMARALSLGLAHDFEIDAPYAALEKSEIVRRGASLGVPFELTLSCMKPAGAGDTAVHCGLCSKCRERHDAFVAAGVADPTEYVDTRYVVLGSSGFHPPAVER
jgi:7-cyano-7-deazaguanine synthase